MEENGLKMQPRIRRPIVGVTIIYIIGIIVGYICCEYKESVLVLFFLIIIFMILVKKYIFTNKHIINNKENKQQNFFYVLIFFLVLGTCTSFYTYSKLTISHVDYQAMGLEESNIELIGVVNDISEKYIESNYDENETQIQYKIILDNNIIKSDKITTDEEEKMDSKVLITTYENINNPEGLIGKMVSVKGIIEIPTGKRNPNCFNYNLYLKTEGVSLIMNGENLEIIDSESKNIFLEIKRVLFQYRYNFSNMAIETLGEDSGSIIIAILFGEKNYISEDNLEKFEQNGIVHIMAVSGLHISIIYGFFVFIFGGAWKKSTCILILLGLIIYGGLANFSPSVTRAILMIGIHICAKLYFFRYDMLSATCCAGLIILFINPMELFSLGFQLSFGAVTLLSIFTEYSKRQKKIIKFEKIIPIIMLQLSLIPFTVYTFNYISFVGILANVPMVFLASITVPFGIICFFFSIISTDIFYFLSVFLKIIGEIIIRINNIFYIEGVSSINMTSPTIWSMILFYFIIIFVFSEGGTLLRIRKKYKEIIIVCMLVFVWGGIFNSVFTDNYKDIKYTFVDVGQGDCIHIKTMSGENILFDGGGSTSYDVGEKVLIPYLLKNGVKKVDLAVITHFDTDHASGIFSLIKEGMIKELVVYQGADVNEQFRELSGNEYSVEDIDEMLKNVDIKYVKAGNIIEIEENAYMEIIWPSEECIEVSESENEKSVVARFNYNGEKVLLTGDIGESSEESIINMWNGSIIESEILKIGHHGSSNSSIEEFLQIVNPNIAIIQVGNNNYGHPSEGVVENLEKKGIIIYRNDLHGAICFYKNGEVKLIGEL